MLIKKATHRPVGVVQITVTTHSSTDHHGLSSTKHRNEHSLICNIICTIIVTQLQIAVLVVKKHSSH